LPDDPILAVIDRIAGLMAQLRGSARRPKALLREKGNTATGIAKMLGVSRATVYRYLTEDRAAQNQPSGSTY
jgi:predicted transcriptional regulator